MSWNHKTRIVAMAVAIQSAAGVWGAPTSADLLAVSPPTNSDDIVTTEDPTASGSVWQAPRIKLSRNSSMGATAPLRGPGGSAPPALGAWSLGRILQAGGMAEIRNATAITGTAQGSGTTTAIVLAAGAPSTTDLYVGFPIQHANVGTAGTVKGNSLIQAYNGTSKAASLAETMAVAVTSGTYTIPPCLVYQQGTLGGDLPLLSVSIWRDKVRYDYIDVRVSALNFDIPVANDQSQTSPSVEFQLRGLPYAKTDEVSPTLALESLPAIPPFRNGKFRLDKTDMGHASTRMSNTFENAAASHADQPYGQDAFEIMSGQRQIDFDINQMNATDYDIHATEENEVTVSTMSLWGTTQGNRFGFLIPALVLDPQNPGDRNGFVNLSGSAWPNKVDKGLTLAIWWD
jgi:hypothetical protein